VLALTLGLEWIGGKSASLSVAIVLLTVGFFCIIIYIFHAQRCEAPLIRLEVFRVRTFAIGIAGNMVARLGIGSIPFLVPLMVQVGLGYSADIAGMLLIAPAVGSLMTKTVVLRVLGRFGYRNTLLCLTLSIACIFACMGIQQPTWPISLLVIHLFVQGILMSGQFSAMNTITLGDLSNELASDGNSLLSVAQNLCQSFGVAISTVLLRLFSDSGSDLDALHATFFAVACITATSALVFMLLRPHDGSHLLKDSHSRQRHGE
jgi:MFS family permease